MFSWCLSHKPNTEERRGVRLVFAVSQTHRYVTIALLSKVAKCYFAQIVHAISYCHRLHVVHRDLKPENVVFFEKQGVVKLTDFGFSNRFQPGKKLNTSCGSLAYSAPEILLGDEYDAPAVGKSKEPKESQF